VDEVLVALDNEFTKIYADSGRPSIPPERLLRAPLLQAFYKIRSEAQLMHQRHYNLLYRWFVGLGATLLQVQGMCSYDMRRSRSDFDRKNAIGQRGKIVFEPDVWQPCTTCIPTELLRFDGRRGSNKLPPSRW